MSRSTVSYDMPVDDTPGNLRPEYEFSQSRKSGSHERRQGSSKKKKHKRPNSFVAFFTDYRTRFVLGVLFCILGLAMVGACISYLQYGAADYSAASSQSVSEMVASGTQVKNAVGPLGAKVMHWMMVDTVGLASLVVVVYLILVGLKLLGVKAIRFWSLTFKCLVSIVALSIILGLLTYNMPSGINWGGAHGHYVNRRLIEISGWIGAYAVTLGLAAILIGVFFNPITKAINSIRSQYHSAMDARRKAKGDDDDDDDDDEDDKSRISLEDLDHDDKPADDNDNQSKPTVVNFDTEPTHSKSTTEEDEAARNATVDFTIELPDDADTDKTSGPVADNHAQGKYDHRAELSRYKFPSLDLLVDRPEGITLDEREQQENKDLIVNTLKNYKIEISSIHATIGPTVTLYEIVPAEGIRIAQIKRLEDDIAMNLAALGIRIIAPIPGKGTIGLEVPNRKPNIVSIRRVLSSQKFRDCDMALPMAMGATISNEIFIADLAKMPHLLVAGATGQGKSVGLNCIIASLLYKKHPTELKFVLVDPKMVEFSLYSKIEKHYLAKLPDEEKAIITDPLKAVETLNALCVEMDMRYDLLSKAGTRSIDEYNRKFTERRLSPERGHRYLPYIVMIVDEFADLTMTAGRDVLTPIARIAQKARAVGMHMILATQRPSTDVITGMIKANFPSRIAFRVSQRIDSMTIIDRPGAHQLIGRGDMLFSINGVIERVQCAFIDTPEVEALVDHIDEQVGFESAYILPEPVQSSATAGGMGGGGTFGDRDDKFDECARFVVTQTTASTSSLQRRFGIGYNKAGKIMDQMEAAGIVGPADGSKPRAVLVDSIQLERILSNS